MAPSTTPPTAPVAPSTTPGTAPVAPSRHPGPRPWRRPPPPTAPAPAAPSVTPPAAGAVPAAGALEPASTTSLLWSIEAVCGAVASALPLMPWSIVPCCWETATASALSLRMFALAAASIGAAMLRFAATARSTGAARSSPRSTFASTLSSDITSLLGSAVAPSASISSIETCSRSWFSATRSSSSPMVSSHLHGSAFGLGYSLTPACETRSTPVVDAARPASRVSVAPVRLREGARIAVVGAGPSGLVAAKHALEAGFDATVFEASGELGGQWHTTRGPQRRVAGHAHEHEPRDDSVLGLPGAGRARAAPGGRADPRLPRGYASALRGHRAHPLRHAGRRVRPGLDGRRGAVRRGRGGVGTLPAAASPPRPPRLPRRAAARVRLPGRRPVPRPPHARLRQRHQRPGDRVRPRAAGAGHLRLPQAALRDPEEPRRRLLRLAVVHALRRAGAAPARPPVGGPPARADPARRGQPGRLRRARAERGPARGRPVAVPGLPRAGPRRQHRLPAGDRRRRGDRSPSRTARRRPSRRSSARPATTSTSPISRAMSRPCSATARTSTSAPSTPTSPASA